jgi:hypothetical protein
MFRWGFMTEFRLSRLSLPDRVALALATLALLAAVVAARAPLSSAPPLCWSVILLGRECPGCGLTRSFAALGRGDVHAANALNPLGPMLLAYAVAVIAVRLGKVAAPRFPWWGELDAGLAGAMVVAVMARTLLFYLG